MKFFFSTLACLLITLACLSQNLRGHIVLHNGDSIFGTVFLAKTAVQVIDTQDYALSFPYSEVKYAKVGANKGRLFFGKLFYYNDAIDNDNIGKEYSDTALIATEIFSTPKMTLYEAWDALKKVHYLVSRPGDSSLTLMAVKYVIPNAKALPTSVANDTKKQHEIKYFISQLKVLFNNCKKISQDRYESMSYRSYSFKEIIRYYTKKCD